MAMEPALKTFMSSPRFAVAGASSNPAKFGHKGEQYGSICGALAASEPNLVLITS